MYFAQFVYGIYGPSFGFSDYKGDCIRKLGTKLRLHNYLLSGVARWYYCMVGQSDLSLD